MTTTAREKLNTYVAGLSTPMLHAALAGMDHRVRTLTDTEQIASTTVYVEACRRARAAHADDTSEALAATLRDHMARPSTDRTRADRADADAVEEMIRERFPEADEAADDYIDAADLDAATDEYAHLRVLLRTAGL